MKHCYGIAREWKIAFKRWTFKNQNWVAFEQVQVVQLSVETIGLFFVTCCAWAKIRSSNDLS